MNEGTEYTLWTNEKYYKRTMRQVYRGELLQFIENMYRYFEQIIFANDGFIKYENEHLVDC